MKSYLITDPEYYGSEPETLASVLQNVFLRIIPEFAVFRDKKTRHYPKLAQAFMATCRHNGVSKILLHGDVLLAKQLGADGVHLTSQQVGMIQEAKGLGLYVVLSTHTYEEALIAQYLGADAITYSPVFASPGKGEPKGLEDLKEIVAKIKLPIFALGGIVTQEQINAVKASGAYGFASIRYFIDHSRSGLE